MAERGDPPAGRQIRIETILTAFSEVQDYVERLTRQRVAELPDGVWETEDYIDYDPSVGEGLIPVRVKMTIDGDQLSYDLSGSHPAIGSFINAGFGQLSPASSPGPRPSFRTSRSTPASIVR